jgi:hypothetical protein
MGVVTYPTESQIREPLIFWHTQKPASHGISLKINIDIPN